MEHQHTKPDQENSQGLSASRRRSLREILDIPFSTSCAFIRAGDKESLKARELLDQAPAT